MSRKITLIGLAALCALAFSAVVASGAVAAETTAYTCVEGSPHEFQTAHCTGTYSSGVGYHHVAIPAGEETQLTLSAIGGQALSAEPFGAELNLVTTQLECVGCMASNSGTTGNMKVSGSGGKLKYSAVTVEAHPECGVTSDPGGVAGVVETEPLKFETNATNHALISPAGASNVLARFNLTGASCELAGTYTVEGDVTAETNGSTLKPVAVAETLTLDGLFPAELRGEATMEAGLTGGTHHPVALT